MKIGFIGTGSMARAIIKGLISTGFARSGDIFCSDVDRDSLASFAGQTGILQSPSNQNVALDSDVLVLAVKPQHIHEVLSEIRTQLGQSKPLLVSIVAGVSLENLETLSGKDNALSVVRVLPNVNAMIGAGVAAVCGNGAATREQIATVLGMFNAVGLAVEIQEHDFAAYAAIAGCSPAFSFLFIDALSRGGVKNGLSKELATRIAAQAVLGSARMVLESGQHPWELIDSVCSPGGTTVAGVVAMEERAFLATVVEGVDATIRRDKELAAAMNK